MRSETSKRILSKTSKDTKSFVSCYARVLVKNLPNFSTATYEIVITNPTNPMIP